MPRPRTIADYLDAMVAGDRATLARAITLVESSSRADRDLALELVEACLPLSGNSIRVGITGAPGAGKSTLIQALGAHILSHPAQTLAVLAIDPSSELTGGSILADKTRMAALASSDRAFIRPSPSRGFPGGVSEHTREAILLCEAAGFRNILVETVGVGQSETGVHGVVDFLVLLALTGAGDELQGIKRGIMEFAHLVAINKADGDNIARAETARLEAQHALHFFPPSNSGWTPRAVAVSALTGRGIADLWSAVLDYASSTRETGIFHRNRSEQNRRAMHALFDRGLRRLFLNQPDLHRRMSILEQAVLEGRITPARAAASLLDAWSSSGTIVSSFPK